MAIENAHLMPNEFVERLFCWFSSNDLYILYRINIAVERYLNANESDDFSTGQMMTLYTTRSKCYRQRMFLMCSDIGY